MDIISKETLNCISLSDMDAIIRYDSENIRVIKSEDHIAVVPYRWSSYNYGQAIRVYVYPDPRGPELAMPVRLRVCDLDMFSETLRVAREIASKVNMLVG